MSLRSLALICNYMILIRPFLSILYNFEDEINYNLEIIHFTIFLFNLQNVLVFSWQSVLVFIWRFV